MLITTTHLDLGWADNVYSSTIVRDTMWLTPYLQKLSENSWFKTDVEETEYIMQYIHRHPEKKSEIERYISEGRLGVAASYVQPYEELYSGESVARQFYFGTKWLSDNFNGYKSSTYFNIDVPGRTLQMPQIMKKSGVDNLFISRHGHGMFFWDAPDGSRVLSYSPGHYISFYNIMAKPDMDAVAALADDSLVWQDIYNDKVSEKGIMPAMLYFEFIWSQAPVENTPVFVEKWNKIKYIVNKDTGEKIPVDLPKFEYSTIDDFFHAAASTTTDIPEIMGERPNVWIYIHGPSHEKAISASREGDRKLPEAEMMSSYLSLSRHDFLKYPQDDINRAWKDKIFPDHGWGGQGGEITDNLFRAKYESSRDEADKVIRAQGTMLASKVKTSNKKGNPVIVFNNLSYERDILVSFDVVFPDDMNSAVIYDASGNKVLSQMKSASDGFSSQKEYYISFVADDMPAMGYRTYYVDFQAPENKKSDKLNESYGNGQIIETEYYKIVLANGGIESLYDKELGKELFGTERHLGAEIITLRSIGHGAGEFGAVQQPDLEGFDRSSEHSGKWEVVEDGDLYITLKNRAPVRHAVVEEYMKVFKDQKRIDVEVNLLNWDAVLYREFRMVLPMAEGFDEISYEVPYGKVTIGKDEMPGAAGDMYQVPNKDLHPRGIGNWVSVSDGEVSLVMTSSVAAMDHIDPTDLDGNRVVLQPILLASRRSCHGGGNEYLQHGDHSYRFTITSVRNSEGNIAELGMSPNYEPPVFYDIERSRSADLPEEYSFLSLDSKDIIVTTFKKCEDDDSYILRLYNKTGKEVVTSLETPYRIGSIIRTNMIEEPLEGNMVDSNKLVIPAYSIETFKLSFD